MVPATQRQRGLGDGQPCQPLVRQKIFLLLVCYCALAFKYSRVERPLRVAAMPKLDELPVELLAHVVLFTNERRVYNSNPEFPISLRELLALQCASRSCKDAVRRAARQHRAVKTLGFQGSSAQKIAAVGRVFGIGCRDLHFDGIQSDACAIALRDFVTSTNGQLRKLSCSDGSLSQSSILVPKPVLLEMCSACPLLQTLYLFHAHDSITANIDDFASAVSSACPLLESVWIPCLRSPAEDYQWYFPRLKRLRFNRLGGSGPIRWDKIELTLRTCVHATEVEVNKQTVLPRLVDLIIAAPVADRLKTLDLSSETDIPPESVLRLARGLGALTDLYLPDDFDGETQFYRSLVQARPAIVRLNLGFDNTLDNEDLRIICHGLHLEHLELPWAENLTDVAIDVILESPCAQTLRSVDISNTYQFSSEDVLRLVRGCPELAKLEWEITSEEWESDDLDQNVDGAAVDALLMSRGGRASGAAYW